MTFAEGFYQYFRACPLFDAGNEMHFDYQGARPTEYSVETPPSGEVLKRYMSGSEVRQKSIYISTKTVYGEDARLQIESSGFYDRFRLWIREQDKNRNYPDLLEGCHAMRLECVTDGYLFSANENDAIYQIQLRLTYLEQGE